jgi:hypothetical protein
MNEYQQFVADKAQSLVQTMTEIGRTNPEVEKVLNAMRTDLQSIILGQERLPTRIMKGWSLYFSPDAYNGIYDAHPKLVDEHAELSWMLRHSNMESYLESKRYLEGL